MNNQNQTQTTFNPGMTLILELVALIKGIAHSVVIPSIIIAIATGAEMQSTQALMLGLIYIIVAFSMYEYYTWTDNKWMRSQKYFYGILFVLGTIMVITTLMRGFANVL